MRKQEEWNNFKKILCVRLDNLGDVLMTTPAIRALKHAAPGREISLLTSSAGSAIAKFIPEIHEIMVFDTAWEKNLQNGSSSIQEMIEKIRGKNFEAAVIFNVYSQNPLPTAMLCYMAGIPRIAGYCRENPYKLITDWIPDEEPFLYIKHEVERQLDLVKNLGAVSDENFFSLRISRAAETAIQKKLESLGVNTKEKLVIIHPGVSEPKRQYPINYFAETAKMIVKDIGYQVLLTGVEAEKNLTRAINESGSEKIFDLAGKISMEEFIALIQMSSVLISNNTGPVHIAAAMKTPVVVLYALTNPQHAPWNVRHKVFPFEIPEESQSKNVIIRYANKKAFTKKPEPVRPEMILSAVKELIRQPKTAESTEVLYL